MSHKKPFALIILDGFGHSSDVLGNAISNAHMPHYSSWLTNYPHTFLKASGAAVGLPAGVPGNSLVGHTTLGAGRIVEQPITQILKSIEDNSFYENTLLKKKFEVIKKNGQSLQLMGLVSDASNHSHEKILHALLRIAHQEGIQKIFVHAFLDGRDTAQRSAATYLERLDAVFDEIGCGTLATMQGRAYPMDRTDNTEMLQAAFSLLTKPQKIIFKNWREALETYYREGLSDEFLPPTAFINTGYIQDNDGLIFFNMRADRARLLTRLFLNAPHLQLAWFITGILYHPSFRTDTLVVQREIPHTLLDMLRMHNISICTITEDEKFAHLTYFFNGRHEISNPHDMYILLPSVPPQHVETHPALSAHDITTMTVCSLRTNPRDFYLINYANADMLGHTGNFNATVKGIEILDHELGLLFEEIVVRLEGTIYLTADHGNAEQMYNSTTNKPHAGHSRNPVPFMVLQKGLYSKKMILPLEELQDVAPYILSQFAIPIPPEMRR